MTNIQPNTTVKPPIIRGVYAATFPPHNDTSDPIPTTHENTIGNIIWTYNSTGIYYGTLTGAFKSRPTGIRILTGQAQGGTAIITVYPQDDDTLVMQVITSGSLSDNWNNIYLLITTY